MVQNEKVIYPENVPGLRKDWTYTTGGAVESSPVVAGGIVYVGSHDHNLYAFDARTGQKLWSYTTGNMIISSPTVVGGIVYVGSNDHNLYAFNQVHKPGKASHDEGE